jgi:hypothetical protein
MASSIPYMVPTQSRSRIHECTILLRFLGTRLLEERGIDESRARPRHRRAFFSDSSSNLELDEVFQISQKFELHSHNWASSLSKLAVSSSSLAEVKSASGGKMTE